MDNPANDWMAAARCCEGPPQNTRFTDLPRAHQLDLLHLGAVAAGSCVFFVALFVLARPLPSRSLAMHVRLPEPPPLRVVSIALPPPVVNLPRPMRREPRIRSGYQLVSVQPAVEEAPPTGRRRNIFSRFFRTIARSVQTSD